ncbi:MAG: capsular polysaccharide biosynthesis protein [Clostridia bacterium]|nr:capsular polysaccharide biosynthesis protein [Clostridia bacterium]
MIDIHSHVLPKMDDGSKSREESISLLRTAYDQGVEAVFSTPHFYPKRDDPEEFLKRRNCSVRALLSTEDEILKKIPVYVGAEVTFFYGMSRFDGLRDFTLGGSDYILIEVPFDKWTAEEVEEVVAVKEVAGLIPVVAHVERYLPFGNKKHLKYLVCSGVVLQSNAEFFIARRSRRKALSFLKKGLVSLIGSDCHNMETRPQNYGEAARIIVGAKKADCLKSVAETERKILSKAHPILSE